MYWLMVLESSAIKEQRGMRFSSPRFDDAIQGGAPSGSAISGFGSVPVFGAIGSGAGSGDEISVYYS